MAAVSALLASINPSVSDDARLSGALADAIALVASMQYPSASVRRAFYGSLGKVFDRIGQEGKGGSVELDLTNLKTTLFGADVEIEALRLLRADAILAICKSSPTMFSKMKNEMRKLEAEEKSWVVRDRLGQAFKGALAEGS